MTVEAIFAGLAVFLGLPAWALLLLTIAAGRRPPSVPTSSSSVEVRVAVLVPAHNEGRNVLPTIACLLPQLKSADQLVVIADNCSDDTAALARAAGATVIERFDTNLRGKGYALDFGIRYLSQTPPEVVIVVDADCTVTHDAISRVSQKCAELDRPIQMLNLMHALPGAGVRIRMLEFAMVVKNLVRPLGAFRLGGGCHLMGTGMALPWKLISTAELATGHIAEDMKLGVDLALAGFPTWFYLDAEVSSLFPESSQTARVQKSRWEHGHLATITEELPRLLASSIKSHSWPLFILSLDLVIPPLAFYVLVLGFATTLSIGLCALFGLATWATTIFLVASASVAAAIGLAWFRFGRQLITARELLSAPLYALWKLPVYVAYVLKRRSGWVRTKRDGE